MKYVLALSVNWTAAFLGTNFIRFLDFFVAVSEGCLGSNGEDDDTVEFEKDRL